MYRVALICLLLLSTPLHAESFIRDDMITDPKPSLFDICYNGTCEELAQVSLKKEQWQEIKDIFLTPSSDAEEEREKIKLAIALMEDMVGKLTGTYVDKAMTFEYMGLEGQLDCIDESINTTIYLTMMLNDGLLKWHSIEDRETRGFFIFGWPHTTAVISDNQSKEKYVVDSWFGDNGEQPHIVPLEIWSDGWKPPGIDEPRKKTDRGQQKRL